MLPLIWVDKSATLYLFDQFQRRKWYAWVQKHQVFVIEDIMGVITTTTKVRWDNSDAIGGSFGGHMSTMSVCSILDFHFDIMNLWRWISSHGLSMRLSFLINLRDWGASCLKKETSYPTLGAAMSGEVTMSFKLQGMLKLHPLYHKIRELLVIENISTLVLDCAVPQDHSTMALQSASIQFESCVC